MPEIHATAIVDPAARLAEDVRVGPFCCIGPEVELAQGVVLESHVAVAGRTSIGARTRLFPFASIGHAPQDLKYGGETSRLEIGSDNAIREHVTMNPGTEGGGMVTRVGDGCLFMVGAHVAHDCQVGDRVILANNATLAGHVVIEEGAIIGGLSAIHQFVRIGRNAMIGGMSGVERDVVPFALVQGERAGLVGLNLVGLRRAGLTGEQIRRLQKLLDEVYADTGTLAERRDSLEASVGAAGDGAGPAAELLRFVFAPSQRGLCRPTG